MTSPKTFVASSERRGRTICTGELGKETLAITFSRQQDTLTSRDARQKMRMSYAAGMVVIIREMVPKKNS